jgi:hypothetical protein
MAYAPASEPRARADFATSQEHWLFAVIVGLCLVEPLVGVLWQALFASAQGLSLSAHHRILLATGLWLTYIADHWFDCHRDGRLVPQTIRHRFVQRHPRLVATLWLTALALQAALAISTLTAQEWLNSGALLACAGAYLALVRSSRHRPLLKEVWMALIYTGGVTLFGWQQLGIDALVASLSFVGLVLLNVCCIAVREHSVDRASGQVSIAIRTHGLGGWLGPAGWTLAAFAALGALGGGGWTPWYAALGGSAAALCLVHENASRLPSDIVHLVVDACLLLPLPLLFA